MATVPQKLLLNTAVGDRKLLGDTQFVVKFERSRPVFTALFPPGTDSVSRSTVWPQVDWIRSIVSGFFQIWPTIGLHGPLPPFDSQIGAVTTTQTGYEITLNVPGGPVTLGTDKDYLVTRVVSFHGKLEEHPSFTATDAGWVYSGGHTHSEDPQGDKIDVHYDFDSSIADGIRLPNKVHVQVNDTVDVRFQLSQCSVVKATVIKLKP